MSIVFTEQKLFQSRDSIYIQMQLCTVCPLFDGLSRSLIHNKCNKLDTTDRKQCSLTSYTNSETWKVLKTSDFKLDIEIRF